MGKQRLRNQSICRLCLEEGESSKHVMCNSDVVVVERNDFLLESKRISKIQKIWSFFNTITAHNLIFGRKWSKGLIVDSLHSLWQKKQPIKKKFFFLLCRVKNRDVTGQLNFLFWKFNDLHVWKLTNFNQKFIIKEIFIQLCKLFMVSLDFERIFIRIFTHDVTVFSPAIHR